MLAARGLLSERESYVLEIAALLHDIGKLGIPDAILKKPGKLTDQEWKVMKAHDGMGVEIIKAAFSSRPLREIVRTHHAWFGGKPSEPDLPTGHEIPVGSRLLAIADTYDAIVSDRVYRKGRGRDEAFSELRRCAGRQFDPEIVDRFIIAILTRDGNRCGDSARLSKKSALKIGLLIERLVEALDAKNTDALRATASRLRATAVEAHADVVADAADRLDKVLGTEADWLDVLMASGDLLELCRSTQASYLSTQSLETDGDVAVIDDYVAPTVNPLTAAPPRAAKPSSFLPHPHSLKTITSRRVRT